MKKIFLFAAMAAIAASSCTKVDEEAIASTSSANSDGSISFGLYTSRVVTNTIDELQEMEPQIESYQTTGDYADASSYVAHMVDRNLFYTASTGRWAVNGIYFWPDSSESDDVISFFSTTADDTTSALTTPTYESTTVYPSFDYTVKADSDTQKIDSSTGAVTTPMDVDDNNMEDILVASVMNESSGQVMLNYQHAMSRVNFKIQGESNGGRYHETSDAAVDAYGTYYTNDDGSLLYQNTNNGYLVYSYTTTDESKTVTEYYEVDYFNYSDDSKYYAAAIDSNDLTAVNVYTATYTPENESETTATVYSSDSGTSYYTFDGEAFTETASYEEDTDKTYYLYTALGTNDVIYKDTTYYTVTGNTKLETAATIEALEPVVGEMVDIDYIYTLKYIQIGALASSGTFTFDGTNSYNSVPGAWTIATTDEKTASYGYYFNKSEEIVTIIGEEDDEENEEDNDVTITGACLLNDAELDLRDYTATDTSKVNATNSLMIMPNDYETGTEFTVTVRYAVSAPSVYPTVDMKTNGGVDGDDQTVTGVSIADAEVGEIYIATITAKIAYDFVEGESTTITVTLPSPGDLITFEAGVGTFDEKYYTASVEKVEDVDDDYVVVVKLPSELEE